MKRKPFLFSVTLGLAGALLIVLSVLLRPTTQTSSAHPLIEAPVSPADDADVPHSRTAEVVSTARPAPASVSGSPLLRDDASRLPESSLPPVRRAQVFTSTVQNLPPVLGLGGIAAPMQTPQIYARYYMDGRNDVFGFDAVADGPVLITITHPVDGIIAAGSTTAGTCEGCAPTDYQLGFPDWTLSAGVSVTVNGGPGMIESVEVVSITGDPNIDTDIVTGDAPPEGEMNAFVQRPGDQANIDSAQVDASGVYTLNFGAEGWDILPGDEFHVYYHAPGGHNVESVFWLAAPEVGLNKWNTGGFARPGGKIVYSVVYWNDGGEVAEDVIIVDTLPVSTTYAGDTSGLTPDIGANGVITWHLGDLPDDGIYGNWGAFAMTLDVAADAPTGTAVITANCATISMSTFGDPNPDNNTVCSSPVDVWDSDVGINVDKWPSPGDPAPGQEFDYTISWCSDYGANFGPVWLTDTLPVSTSVVSWSADWPWGLWTEVITTGGQFVLYAPGLPGGDWCQHIYLRLLVDPNAPEEMLLSNHVIVETPDDAQPANNERLNEDALTSNPRPDLYLDKSLHSGVLVPGGWINYFIWYNNQGNMAAPVSVTETVPAGLSFDSAWWGGGQSGENEPLPDPIIVGDQLVWNLDDLPVNGSRWFHVQMNITDTLEAGDILTNCAAVSIHEGERTPEDNTDCYAVSLNPTGPNLRVTKESWWNGDGQLGYRIYFDNLGDVIVTDAWITDTLPNGTAWDGWWNLNFDWNRLVSESLDSDILAWQFSGLYPGDNGQIEFNANLDEPGAPVRWFTNTVEITALPNETTPEDNIYTDVAFSGGEVQSVDLDVYRSRIWGQAPQGPVTVTTAAAEMVYGDGWDEQEFPDTFDPGDVVTITAGAGLYPVIITIPDPFTGQTSSITDTIWGQIDALDHEMVEVDLWGFPTQSVETDNQGHYRATYPDIPHNAQGDVGYQTEIDYAWVGFHHRLVNPDLVISVDYSQNGVDGNYERGHTGWVTVTSSITTEIKATVEVTTELWPWWGGNSGFSTHHHQWEPEQPDIVPGDWVYAMLDNGYGTAVQVGTINAGVDVVNEIMSGTLDVPWFSEGLQVSCEIHEENAPGIQIENIDPDGGEFYCDFNGMWDITPGQNVAVRYNEPDGDSVLFRPANPAPHLRVEKWLESGNLGVGGNAAFYVQYSNEGDDVAADVIITDTLQGMTYITDTSGFAHTGSGGEVIWDLGTVAPGDWIHFYVFAEVTAAAGERVTNTVQIATSNLYDRGAPSEKWSEWSDNVQPNDTYLNIGKASWTGDPAAGYDIVFQVNPCNNGGTASSEVTITDTLHPSMTLQIWWSDSPGWYEVSSSVQELVLTKPALMGWRCESVYVRAHVDVNAWPGMPISNTVAIYAANDLNGGDDETWWGNVNTPHTNLSISKNWGSGQLVPGGELHYWINIHNNGNVPVGSFRITDTLPVLTTFRAAWHQDQYGQQYEFLPAEVGAGYVVWEFTGLENGFGDNFEVVLDVDADALPGTVLVNTAEVTPLPGEDSYDDNMSIWTETLFDHGLNLRVRKDGQWDDWGTDTRRVSYDLNIENVGDVQVDMVTITDTYPVGMHLDGSIGSNYWQWWEWSDNGDHFTITLELLEPGWSVGFNFGLITDTSPLPFGLIFTNTAEVMLVEDDVNPDDNTDTVVLTTGPDLWMKKDVVDGTFLPGELVTFSLVFGNDRYGHEWWWNTQGDVWITDTLPSGFEFITATRRSQGWAPYPPDVTNGEQLAWNTGDMPAGGEDELLVTVRIPASATGLDTFTNWAEVASSEPVSDTEPYYDNNANYVDVMIDLPYFEVSKAYESTAVAGMPITYTLTVTNSGNSVGTGIILSDTIPDGLENVSGGTIILPWMWWYINSLAANGGSATEMFTATLPCRGAVVNDDYRVVDSDQGVSSAVGAPVSLDVLAPTLNAGFDQSAVTALVSATLRFTDTSTTNGPAIAAWVWDFDDGHSTSEANVTHTYTTDGVFTVRLTITDTCGYTATTTGVVTVDAPALVASFAQSAASTVVSTTVYFTDTSTTDVPPIAAWAWDFGDESAPVFTQDAGHTYTGEGVFPVTLTVTDTLGYTATASSVVTVTAPALVASFDQSAVSAVAGTTVYFTDTSATDMPPIVAWAWDFGDHGVSAGQNPTHTYNTAGEFTITLVVTDALGYSDAATSTITVTPACIPLTGVSFTYQPAMVLVNTLITFTTTYSPVNATSPITYDWSFGDGQAAVVVTTPITHTYTTIGEKTVRLTAYNSCTAGGVTSQQIINVTSNSIFLPLVLRNF